jgi:hypothetical protein
MDFIKFCGMIGGILGELIKWYKLRTSENLPKYLKSPFYWIITLLVIISGGILAVLYGYVKVSAILAVNIGISAPLLIQSFARIKTSNSGLDSHFDENNRESKKSLRSYFNEKQFNLWHFLAGE